jgi:hypothetical protein
VEDGGCTGVGIDGGWDGGGVSGGMGRDNGVGGGGGTLTTGASCTPQFWQNISPGTLIYPQEEHAPVCGSCAGVLAGASGAGGSTGATGAEGGKSAFIVGAYWPSTGTSLNPQLSQKMAVSSTWE